MSKGQVRVIQADPYHPVLGVMMHPLAQRVIDYARVHAPETDPKAFARQYLPAIYLDDPSVLLLALVDEQATIVGHVLASMVGDGVNKWAVIVQYRADGSVGDAGLVALDFVQRWAEAAGTSTVVLTVRNEDDKWEKRGFKTVRHVYLREKGE